MRWRSYPQYKPSGVGWLGEIPKHWEVKRIKNIGKVKYGLGEPPDQLEDGWPFIRATDIYRGKINSKSILTVDPQDIPWSRDPILRTNDILVVRSGAYTGDSAIVPEEWAGAIAGYDMILRVAAGAVPQFVAYALLSKYLLNGQIYLERSRAAQPHLNAEELGSFIILWPTRLEQKRIVACLNSETARIDALMEKKQRQIELLQEKRAALISHAVTKGLDPTVPMKDPGLDWLGHIPAHWELKRLKFVAKIQTGLTLGKNYKDVRTISRPYLRVANVQDGYLDLNDITEIFIPEGDTKRHELKHGDVLMTEGGDFDKLGRGYVWEGQIEGCLHQNHIFAVRPNLKYLASLYLATLMTSSYGKAYFTSTSQQTTNLATTNISKLKNYLLPLPNVREQCLILDWLGQNISKIDGLSAKIQESIDRLKEYRTALISAVVMGQIDVREEAA